MDVEILVKKLKAILKKRGISPSVAGRESGCGADFIPNMEYKKSAPSYIRVQQMAQYLGMTTSELLGEDVTDLPKKEAELLKAYRAADDSIQSAVRRVLGVD